VRRINGPYRKGNRWRVVEADCHTSRTLRVHSFASKDEASKALHRLRRDSMVDAGGELARMLVNMATPMPLGCSWLYFLLDFDGCVVYVGITGQPGVRVDDHREQKDFDRAVVVPHPYSRDEAARLEVLLIRVLQPRLNNTARGTRAETDVPHADGRARPITDS
jgi:hypothetical protein